MPTLVDRAQGALAGLALGDVLGSPSEGLSPQEIAEKWGRIKGFVAETPVGSDDTEYALLTAKALLMHGTQFSSDTVADLWRSDVIHQEGQFKGGGFSEMSAIHNLRRGMSPPRSGQHSHSWSDGLAMRVAPIGIVACGQPDLAAELTEYDGLVSHSGEGIYSGQAVAASVAVAMAGGSLEEQFQAALSVIPEDSWTHRGLVRAEQIAGQTDKPWEQRALEAVDEFALDDFYWTDLAPEAVPLAYTALLAGEGDLPNCLLNAVNMGRDSDTVAAIAGGIAGAAAGIHQVPEEWLPVVTTAPGVCLRVTEGMHPLQVAADLVDLIPAFAPDSKGNS